MRKAAGIILIIVSVVRLVDVVINAIGMPHFVFGSMFWWSVLYWIVWGGLLLAGGVLCIKRRYWGLCLVSALLTFLVTILPAVEALTRGNLAYFMNWRIWITVVGTLISTIFIFLTKKEWKEFSDSVDSEVSNGGQNSFLPRRGVG